MKNYDRRKYYSLNYVKEMYMNQKPIFNIDNARLCYDINFEEVDDRKIYLAEYNFIFFHFLIHHTYK